MSILDCDWLTVVNCYYRGVYYTSAESSVLCSSLGSFTWASCDSCDRLFPSWSFSSYRRSFSFPVSVKCFDLQLERRHEQMKRNLEAQYKELEEKRRVFEEEKANWEAQQRILEQQKLDASKWVTLTSDPTPKVNALSHVFLVQRSQIMCSGLATLQIVYLIIEPHLKSCLFNLWILTPKKQHLNFKAQVF